jgi:hypothetical protein
MCHFSIGLAIWNNLRGTRINYNSALKVPNLLPGYGTHGTSTFNESSVGDFVHLFFIILHNSWSKKIGNEFFNSIAQTYRQHHCAHLSFLENPSMRRKIHKILKYMLIWDRLLKFDYNLKTPILPNLGKCHYHIDLHLWWILHLMAGFSRKER